MVPKFWPFKGDKKGSVSPNLLQSVDSASIPANYRVYAIGDIHGMANLLHSLMSEINDDPGRRGVTTYLIFLGDNIDRGPHSCSVIDYLAHLPAQATANECLIFLKGNHEKMLLDFMDHPSRSGKLWLNNGGDATLASYGLHVPPSLTKKNLVQLRDEFAKRLPCEHWEFLRNLKSKFEFGDYFFCHAGIKIGQALADQKEDALLWSRQYPDNDAGPQEKIIVHGHQPVALPAVQRYHINVDTGAYVTGRLTALKIEGNKRHFISTK